MITNNNFKSKFILLFLLLVILSGIFGFLETETTKDNPELSYYEEIYQQIPDKAYKIISLKVKSGNFIDYAKEYLKHKDYYNNL